ncbi:methionyl-tRNA formyltransferase [Patescibacteria group bacterium]
MVKKYLKKNKVIFFGTDDIAINTLKWLIDNNESVLVVTQPDKPIGRKRTITPSPVKIMASKHSLPVLQPGNLRSDNFKTTVNGFKPTVGLVAAYGKLIPEWLINNIQMGLLNIHPSLLPAYRGPSPVQNALLDGKLITGISLMLIDKGMDTGPLLGQYKINIEPDDDYIKLINKINDKVSILLDKYFNKYLNGGIQPTAQGSGGFDTKLIYKGDGKINWRESANKIYNRYRAYIKWPGIWTTWNGRIIKLLEIKLSDETSGKPGLVYQSNSNKLIISCGQGSIIVNKLQLEGKTPQLTNDWILGYPKIIGSVIGS